MASNTVPSAESAFFARAVDATTVSRELRASIEALEMRLVEWDWGGQIDPTSLQRALHDAVRHVDRAVDAWDGRS